MAIGAIIGGVSAAVSLGTSLFGNNSSANDDAERAQIKQRKEARKQAREINEYNEEKDRIEKENYFNNREYSYETAIKSWEYKNEIQDFQYQNSLAIYNERLNLSEEQIGLNEEAAKLGINTQQAAFKDFEIDQAFQRESIFADLQNTLINQGLNRKEQDLRFETTKTSYENELTNLGFNKLQQQASLFGIQSSQRIGTERIQTELKNLYNRTAFDKEAASIKAITDSGQAALGQAGKSRGKSIQSAQAESFRTLRQLESALKGSRRSAAVQLLNLNVDSAVRETNVNLDIDRIDEAIRFAGVRSKIQTKQIGIDTARIDQAINFANDEADFNNRILVANRESRIAQFERDIAAIELQRTGADLNARAQVGVLPTEAPYEPMPELPPERIFQRSRKLTYQDVLGPQAPIPSTEPSTGTIIQQGLNLVSAGANIYEAFKAPPTNPLFENPLTSQTFTGQLDSNIYNPNFVNPNSFLFPN